MTKNNLKTCSKCKKSKPSTLEYFSKDSSKKDGLYSSCKDCRKKYIEENPEKMKDIRDRYKNKNPEKIRKWKSDSAKRNRKTQRDYYHKNKKRLKQKSKERYEKNKITINKKQREYEARRKQEEPLYKFKGRIRKLIHRVISRNGYTKRSKCTKILGCDWNFFKKHLEETFEFNYGIPRQYINWSDMHIDHIIPLNTASSEEEILSLNHYTNLQILYAEDNMEKSAKLNWELK